MCFFSCACRGSSEAEDLGGRRRVSIFPFVGGEHSRARTDFCSEQEKASEEEEAGHPYRDSGWSFTKSLRSIGILLHRTAVWQPRIVAGARYLSRPRQPLALFNA